MNAVDGGDKVERADLKASLLSQLASRTVLGGLAQVLRATRDAPSTGRRGMGAADEEDGFGVVQAGGS